MTVISQLGNTVGAVRSYRVIRNDCRGFNNLSVWNELDYRVDVCGIKGCTFRTPVRYVTKTWSVVLLNKKNLKKNSQVYCV